METGPIQVSMVTVAESLIEEETCRHSTGSPSPQRHLQYRRRTDSRHHNALLNILLQILKILQVTIYFLLPIKQKKTDKNSKLQIRFVKKVTGAQSLMPQIQRQR